jgi:UDP-N-acetylmuramyl tripeptide synthase
MNRKPTASTTSPTLRTGLALGLGKLSQACLRQISRLNLSCDGTSFPGRIMLMVDSSIIATLSQHCQGIILVTGTNGKTSTTALLAELLRQSGQKVLSNPEGANMVSGLATALLRAKPRPRSQTNLASNSPPQLAVLEVDESSLTPLARLLPQVNLITVTNLFPDQLDRHGSVQALADRMQKALAAWPTASLVLNANDPLVASWGQNRPDCHFFTVNAAGNNTHQQQPPQDLLCPCCRQSLHYNRIHYAQLGAYVCPHCAFHPPAALVEVQPLEDKAGSGTALLVRTPREKLTLHSPLTGLYNTYNTAAALATMAAWLPSTSLRSLAPALASFQTPAGRTEYFRWPRSNKQAALALAKNPAGFNQVLTTLISRRNRSSPITLLVAINDLPADGRDISWLKDIHLDNIPLGSRAICSGRRAHAVAERFRASSLPPAHILVKPNLRRAVKAALQTPAADIVVLCNYTVLSPLRAALLKTGGETFTARPVVRKYK